MKISAARIKQIIREEHKKIAGEAEISLDTEDIEASSPSEAAGASVSVVIQELKGVLEEWEEGEYDSDEERWRAYAKDIQGVVDEHANKPSEEHTEEECEEVHPDQTHEEWETKQEEKSEEGEEPKKKSKKKENKSSSDSKSKSPKLAKMTYESKKKRLNNELVKMIKEQITSLKRG